MQRRRPPHRPKDAAVSPVIAVILMVAVTFMLAATVYVWVAGFQQTDSGGESASISSAGLDADNDGLTDWVRVTLARGENAPYGQANIAVTLLAPSGAVLLHTEDNGILCIGPSAQTDGGNQECAAGLNFIAHGTNTAWELGETFYLPCQAAGAHQLTLAVRGSTVLDERIVCDEAAA